MFDEARYNEFTLDSGLHVALLRRPSATVNARLDVFHGSLHEQPGEEGVAHFLEHTIMTGGNARYSPEETERVLDVFGDVNAMTALDRTFFPADMLPEDVETYLSFFSEVGFSPTFAPRKVEEERGAVLREMADAKSQPGFKEGQEFWRAVYRNNIHRYFGLGTEQVVSTVTSEGLQAFHARGYHANNMRLVMVGELPKQTEALINQHFGNRPTGNGARFEFPSVPPLEEQIIREHAAPEMYNHDTPQASSADMMLAVVVPPETHEDSYALRVLAYVLGGGPTSKLHKAIRSERGLAYGVGAGYSGSNNVGVFYVSGRVSGAEIDEVIDATFEEIRKLQTEPVEKEKLDTARRKTKYSIGKQFETNEGVVQAITSRIEDGLMPETIFEQFGNVTPGKIMEVANKYLPKDRDGVYALFTRNPLKRDG